jgi:hypothetical protein
MKSTLVQGGVLIALGLLLSVVLLEAVSGCGQAIYNADGTWATGQCVFVPYTPTVGKW